FWGVQTLRQLLPVDRGADPTVPAVQIADAPRYPWRGVMLDVARHFYPVSFVKRQIDLMSYYKFDVFHWHLTDDQGWRIQINKYPKLTSVGAWRTEADGKSYGGFYTQAEIREVVAYAKARNVMVVPEIEMPGHSSAAIAAYPDLSCSGKPISVPTTWGVLRNVDCVGKAQTFHFLENVLDEVTKLFPSQYVHIGGDEVPEGVWDDCKACAGLAKANGFQDDEQGLHSYFVGRIEKYLASKDKTLVGWDEILEGGLSPHAIVEVWRGPDEAKKALANGNRIIIAGPFYMDTPIDRMTLQDLYRTDPFDNPLYASHPKQVLGGEAPLWSERATPRNGDARLYPRLLAISEHFWNQAAQHDWNHFLVRARAQEAWLASQHVAYGPENKDIVDYRLIFNPTYERW
ncbi:MAG: beta-N-acetylhexosaminidase, partial [Gammaproteobacteria bacterium]